MLIRDKIEELAKVTHYRCIPWPHTRNKMGTPLARYKGVIKSVGRHLLELRGDQKLDEGSIAVCTCKSKGCVNVNHYRWGKIGERRKYRTKLNALECERIKASSMKNLALAHDYGVSEATISRVKRGLYNPN